MGKRAVTRTPPAASPPRRKPASDRVARSAVRAAAHVVAPARGSPVGPPTASAQGVGAPGVADAVLLGSPAAHADAAAQACIGKATAVLEAASQAAAVAEPGAAAAANAGAARPAGGAAAVGDLSPSETAAGEAGDDAPADVAPHPR
eukprot:9487877-Pyramimonas_sp.AAC.1